MYGRDETIVERAATPLAEFLSHLARSVKRGVRINILVHSMGNRAVLNALNRLPQSANDGRPFHHVVFAAPDVGAARFRTQVAEVRQKPTHGNEL
ncbi:MAG: alpha/beta hydrolase [Fuerstiella sp.]|nr:alpha/beta hydrolase [Fuerstiella sp.]MCP4858255.1 alpha/beta hydrolase [Fuerstiella sp.]